jgi:hypothetical protein
LDEETILLAVELPDEKMGLVLVEEVVVEFVSQENLPICKHSQQSIAERLDYRPLLP